MCSLSAQPEDLLKKHTNPFDSNNFTPSTSDLPDVDSWLLTPSEPFLITSEAPPAVIPSCLLSVCCQHLWWSFMSRLICSWAPGLAGGWQTCHGSKFYCFLGALSLLDKRSILFSWLIKNFVRGTPPMLESDMIIQHILTFMRQIPQLGHCPEAKILHMSAERATVLVVVRVILTNHICICFWLNALQCTQSMI